MMNAATSPSHPNGNSRPRNGEPMSPTLSAIAALMVTHWSCRSCVRAAPMIAARV
jgi:hypothetical protein